MSQFSSEMQYSKENLLARKIPKPSHRHAAPAGPWPYIDNLTEQDSEEVIDAKIFEPIGSCGHNNCNDCRQWISYPQSHFGNWTIKPVRKCGIERAVKDHDHDCTIYTVDVMEDGVYQDSGDFLVTPQNKRDYWNNILMSKRESGIRVRALFVAHMSGHVLQMLGARYNVEPFFFSSSINWIPSRYQENAVPKTGDHITVTLTFIRIMHDVPPINISNQSTLVDPRKGIVTRLKSALSVFSWWSYFARQIEEPKNIDTLAPVHLHSTHKLLYPDFLGIHMIRDVEGSTIISYHHDLEGFTTPAEDLYARLKLVGRSVYWQLIIRDSKDPTFVFLAILWSALYAWDEALEALYAHFTWLESRVITTNDVALTYELHIIRAHLLHYISLLRDFRTSVEFVRVTANPAMDSDDIDDKTRTSDKKLLDKECGHLLSEIQRLEVNRKTLDDRVQNVQNLVYTSVNIEDSKAMKRLSYITMIFLPASFVANAFGMNVTELNTAGMVTLARFFEVMVPLTLVTVWIIVAFQSRFVVRDEHIWKKLLWPIMYVNSLLPRSTKKDNQEYELT